MPIVTVIPTVTAEAYSTGNAVGGKLTFANLAPQGSGVITRCVLRDKAGQVAAYDLFLFGADPVAATITTKTAFAISTDLAICFGVIPLVGLASGGTGGGLISSFGLYLPFNTRSGADVYGALVTRSSPTYSGVSDISITLQSEDIPK